MTSDLTVENLPVRVILAYVYEVDELKNSIRSFVRKDLENICALISSDEWLDFASENREMAKQIGADIRK